MRQRNSPPARVGRFNQVRCAVCALSLLIFQLTHVSYSADVTAEMGKASAWVGEGISVYFTLYSPGPFSGTASFEIPELPQTVFLKVGSPVVGSETVNGESLLTQRHEFKLFTQRAGEIVIPSFPIRFEAKKTFIGDAEPVEAASPELRFQSKRPPGSESLGLLVTATEMTATQTWMPQSVEEHQVGDVLERTITRVASGTSAMMLTPVSPNAPEGIRIYPSPSTVEDSTARGQSVARRVDIIKYQFERDGTFELPAVDFRWWDPSGAEIKQATLEAHQVEVKGAQTPSTTQTEAPTTGTRSVGIAIAVFVLLALGVKRLPQKLAELKQKRSQPEEVAAREVSSACLRNDPTAAYSALLSWQRAVAATKPTTEWNDLIASSDGQMLLVEWDVLSAHLFDRAPSSASWSGSRLRKLFRRVRSASEQTGERNAKSTAELPELNPTRRRP